MTWMDSGRSSHSNDPLSNFKVLRGLLLKACIHIVRSKASLPVGGIKKITFFLTLLARIQGLEQEKVIHGKYKHISKL